MFMFLQIIEQTQFKDVIKDDGIHRLDKGCENLLICHYMVTVGGLNRSRHIAGSSVHNQWVEQIFRDVY